MLVSLSAMILILGIFDNVKSFLPSPLLFSTSANDCITANVVGLPLQTGLEMNCFRVLLLNISTELSLKVNGVFPAAERVVIQSEGLCLGVEGGACRLCVMINMPLPLPSTPRRTCGMEMALFNSKKVVVKV